MNHFYPNKRGMVGLIICLAFIPLLLNAQDCGKGTGDFRR